MNKKTILDQFASELQRSSDHTRQSRVFYAEKFLEFAEDKPLSEWNKELVYSFLNQLKKEDYADGTIRHIYGIVKRVFDAASVVYEAEKRSLLSSVNPSDATAIAAILKVLAMPPLEWPMGKRGAPEVKEANVVAPALSVEDISKMIRAAKETRLQPAEAACVALSTTFGLRREELARIGPDDIKDGTIFINTVKGGMTRIHQIPQLIIPFITGYDFTQVFSLYGLSSMYCRIENKSGVEHQYGGGWHSPRRTLDTLLMDRLPLVAVRLFLRWKIKSSTEMAFHYYSKDLGLNDSEVFAVHPFLPLWS